jgi:hypothetical protein
VCSNFFSTRLDSARLELDEERSESGERSNLFSSGGAACRLIHAG